MTLLKLVAMFLLLVQLQACTMIMVGKRATADGSVMVAHTDDNGSGAADLRIVRVQARENSMEDERPVYQFKDGLPRVVLADTKSKYAQKGTEKLSVPLGYIPEVSHTFAYYDMDYGLMNEHHLSISETTAGAKTAGWPVSAPVHGNCLFGIASLTKIALERCITARCAIKTIGDLSVKYGFFSDDSGDPKNPDYSDSAEVLGIADQTGEAWVLNLLTGPKHSSAVWAAQRVPDHHVHISANTFTIREMDLDDRNNFMASGNIHSFAREMGWWNGEDTFDFYRAYGFDANGQALGSLYSGRRAWRFYALFSPSQEFNPDLGYLTNRISYPFSLAPDNPVELKQVFQFLRDHYEGTPFDMTVGIAAGPYGNPIQLETANTEHKGGVERATSIYRTLWAFVCQCFPPFLHIEDTDEELKLPQSDISRGVFWLTLSRPDGSVFLPFFAGQESMPPSYSTHACDYARFDRDCAWWAYNFVNQWVRLQYNFIMRDVVKKQSEVEERALNFVKAIRKEVSVAGNCSSSCKPHVEPSKACRMSSKCSGCPHCQSLYLAHRTNQFANTVTRNWWKFGEFLMSKYHSGLIILGEEPGDMIAPGYPKWWQDVSGISDWPGKHFLFPPGKKEKSRMANQHAAPFAPPKRKWPSFPYGQEWPFETSPSPPHHSAYMNIQDEGANSWILLIFVCATNFIAGILASKSSLLCTSGTKTRKKEAPV